MIMQTPTDTSFIQIIKNRNIWLTHYFFFGKQESLKDSKEKITK
jgi:hypothetical protein